MNEGKMGSKHLPIIKNAFGVRRKQHATTLMRLGEPVVL